MGTRHGIIIGRGVPQKLHPLFIPFR